MAAVVAYHLGHLRGGYLGVDLFFVLSGFLITTLLLRERATTGRVRLGAFWARRARRLLPALGATLLAVAVAGRLLLPAERLPALRIDALTAAGYVANWRFATATSAGYFAQHAVSPLRHTWSLAIEEQYYLLWPLLAVAALAVARARRWSPAAAIGTVAAIGFAASAAWSAVHADAWTVDRLYLGTDTRALAPLAGALLACLLGRQTSSTLPDPGGLDLDAAAGAAAAAPAAEPATQPPPIRRQVAGLVGAVGLGGLAVATATVTADHRWMYRGGFVVAAVASAAAIVGGVAGPAWFRRPLAVAPLRWLGERSYGLYLYSWPIQVLAEARGVRGASLTALTVVAAGLVAEASYRWLELPIRRGGRARPTPATALAAIGATGRVARTGMRSAAAAAVVVGAVVAATATSARPDPLTTKSDAELRAEALRPAATVPAADAGPGAAGPTTTTPTGHRVVPTDRPLRVMVAGDSVGYTIGTYAPTDLANETVDPRAIVGCGLQISGPRPEGMVEVGAPDTYDECNPLIVQAEANGLAGRPDVVLYVTGGWELARHDYRGATVGPGDATWARYLRGLLELRVASLTSTGAVVALWADTCGPFSEHRVDQRWYRDDVLAPVADEHDDVVLLDPDAPLCGPNGEPLVDIAGVGNPRSDGAHFTEAGAAWFWHAFLADALREAAAGG